MLSQDRIYASILIVKVIQSWDQSNEVWLLNNPDVDIEYNQELHIFWLHASKTCYGRVQPKDLMVARFFSELKVTPDDL